MSLYVLHAEIWAFLNAKRVSKNIIIVIMMIIIIIIIICIAT